MEENDLRSKLSPAVDEVADFGARAFWSANCSSIEMAGTESGNANPMGAPDPYRSAPPWRTIRMCYNASPTARTGSVAAAPVAPADA